MFGGGEMVYNQLVTLMKKFLCLLFVPLMVLAVSCKKDEQNNNDKIPVPEAIDLGITVDGKTVKWASFNIGASKPWEYGNYYAWGECEPKEVYSWETYAYSNANGYLTKYCPKDDTSYWDMTAKPEGPDGITTLYPSDDVAHVKLGGKWRMPTPDEIDALLALKENADYTWEPWVYATDENGNEARDANGNIIYGLRITRISNSAVLFLPAAGYRQDANLVEAGAGGGYWSNSLYSTSANPRCPSLLEFNSNPDDHISIGRAKGLPVRPVCVE